MIKKIALSKETAVKLQRQIASAQALATFIGECGSIILPPMPQKAQYLVDSVMSAPLVAGSEVLFFRRQFVAAAIMEDICHISLVARIRLKDGTRIFVPDSQLIVCSSYDSTPIEELHLSADYENADFLRPSENPKVLGILARNIEMKFKTSSKKCIRHLIRGMVYNAQPEETLEFEKQTTVFPGGVQSSTGIGFSLAFWQMEMNKHSLLEDYYRTFPALPELIREVRGYLLHSSSKLLDVHVLRFGKTRFNVHRDLHGDDVYNFNIKQTVVVLLSEVSSSMRIVGGEEIFYHLGEQRIGVGVSFLSRLYHSSMPITEKPRFTSVAKEWKIVFFFGDVHDKGCAKGGACRCRY